MATITCDLCGEINDDDRKHCGKCGTPLASAARLNSDGDRSNALTDPCKSIDPWADEVGIVTLTVSGTLGRRLVHLEPGQTLEIGSGIGSLTDLCPDNISRRHAEIRVGTASVEVVDRGSADRGSMNGTFVDGCRLTPMAPTRVVDGAVITLGADPPLTIVVSFGPRS